jgi:hypothetical protein
MDLPFLAGQGHDDPKRGRSGRESRNAMIDEALSVEEKPTPAHTGKLARAE